MKTDRRKAALVFLAVCTFFVLLAFNVVTPMIADDYNYSFSFHTGQRITSLLQIPDSMYDHYQIQGGRLVVHALAQMLLMLPPLVFDVLNAGMFVLFSWLLYRFGFERGQNSPAAYLLLLAGMWWFLPMPGQTFLWVVGSANYLWGAAISLGWLLCFYKLAERNAPAGPLRTVGMTVWAFFAGWCNENTSAAVLLAAGLLMLILLTEHKRWRVWMVTGCMAGFVGWLVMVLSPGNAARAAREGAGAMSLSALVSRTVNCTVQLQKMALPLVAIFGALLVLGILNKTPRGILLRASTLFVAGVAANYAMVGTADYADRAGFGVVALLLASCMVLLRPALHSGQGVLVQAGAGAAALVLVLGLLPTFIPVYQDFRTWQSRQQEVQQQAAAGVKDVTANAIRSKSEYSVFYQLSDLTEDPDHWANIAYAKYFGLDSVTGVTPKEKTDKS